MTYTSETGQRVARISIKQNEHRDKKGKTYFLYDIKVIGDLEDEVIGTINSLRRKLK